MYPGHQRNAGINRQGNGSGNNNHTHYQSGNGKNRSIGNNGGGCGNNTSRYSGNTKPNTNNTGNNPSASSSGNSSISSNTSNNSNVITQSPTSSVSGPSVKSKGHSDSNWSQYCQEWNQYIFKGRQHGRESNNHNTANPHNPSNSNNGLDGANVSQGAGIRNGMGPGPDKRNGSVNPNGQGPVKAEVTGVTLKENYQPIEGEKKINAANDCDQNAVVKPFTSYSNSNRYNSRGNWNNRGRGGGKGRGYNNSSNRGGGGNRGIIQYPNGYYPTPMPSAPGLGVPVDTFGGYNFISVAATPFQLAPYLCCEPECQLCPPPPPPAQTCYSTANGLIPQYYSLPAAFQYVPVSIGAPDGLQPTEVAPTPGPPLPPMPPTIESNFDFC